MRFEIDIRSTVPPGDQLADAVRFAISAGRIAAGDRLPSIRDVARDARVNPNTVSRAWRELEFEGLVESQRGLGTFVTQAALQRARARCRATVEERLARAIRGALSAGLAADAVVDLCHEYVYPSQPEEDAA